MDRRQLLGTALGAAAAATATGVLAADPDPTSGLTWHAMQDSVEGKGWTSTLRPFDRLPEKAKTTVRPPVWDLSRHSAGMLVRFETDAPALSVRYSLLASGLALPHMPATGVSGLDLYAQDERGRDRWLAVVKPTAQKTETLLASGIDPLADGTPRRYTLYLPLYNGTESLEIGISGKAVFRPLPPRKERPVVFYGTSILQGACASRPGMAFTSILGRRLDRPVINLGFSGNGTMDPSMADLLAELDPSVYVIDCLPNMNAQAVAERTEPLVRTLRRARPETPILLVEDRTVTSAPFHEGTRRSHQASRAALRGAYRNLKAAGIRHLAYLDGDLLLGDDGEGATDGSHPNDLGMVRYADAYERALRPLLKE